MAFHLSKIEFAQVVEQALADLPQPFSDVVEQLSIEILDRATPAHRRKADVDQNYDLLGYYSGLPLLHQSVEHSGTLPGVIYIFQEAHEQMAHTRAQLIEEIRTTVLHEIGHHFGMDEEDLEELGYD